MRAESTSSPPNRLSLALAAGLLKSSLFQGCDPEVMHAALRRGSSPSSLLSTREASPSLTGAPIIVGIAVVVITAVTEPGGTAAG